VCALSPCPVLFFVSWVYICGVFPRTKSVRRVVSLIKSFTLLLRAAPEHNASRLHEKKCDDEKKGAWCAATNDTAKPGSTLSMLTS